MARLVHRHVSRRVLGRGRGAFGDVALPLSQGFSLPSDAWGYLRSQVNRFTRATPALLIAAELPAGTPDTVVALNALTVYQKALLHYGIIDPQLLAAANMAFGNPLAFVTANMRAVAGTITGYADALGLAGAAWSLEKKVTVGILMAAAVGVFVFWPKGLR